MKVQLLLSGLCLGLANLTMGGFFTQAAIASPTQVQSSKQVAQAAPYNVEPYDTPQQRVCPSIYYEEPFNSAVFPPSGCPANELGTAPYPGYRRERPPVPDTTPIPQVLRSPVTTISPQEGMVGIRLVNQTNVPVWYFIVGVTDNRALPAGSSVYLSGLDVPVQMTFHRDDDGFVTANPQTMESGVLELRLDETAEFSASESGLIIQETGDVIIN
jgi:hypothetical protein